MAQRQSRTHTLTKSGKAQEQAAINGIKNGESKQEQAAEKKADEKFLGMSTATYVTAIENAAGFAKSALHLELAVGLSLFAQNGSTSLEAKRDLYTIYGQAGYKCASPNDEDYKTVNRRINVAAEFFDWLGGKPQIDEWTLATSEMQSIQAIVRHLEDEFNFRGMNSVMAHIGKPVILKRDREKAERKAAEKPQEILTELPKEGTVPTMHMADELYSNLLNMEKNNTLPTGAVEALSAEKKRREEKAEMDEAEKKMLEAASKKSEEQKPSGEQAKGEQKRRKTDREDVHMIRTEHLELAVPLDISKDELMQMSMQLLELANTLAVAEA